MPKARKPSRAEKRARVTIARRLAEAQWKAEEENSKRLHLRSAGLLAVLAALGTIGLFKIPQFRDGELWTQICVVTLALIGSLCLLVAIAQILDIKAPDRAKNEPHWRVMRKSWRWIQKWLWPVSTGAELRGPPFASARLFHATDPAGDHKELPPDPGALLDFMASELEEREFAVLVKAAMDLHARNAARQELLSSAQIWLVRGAMAWGMIFLVCSCPAASHAENPNEGTGRPVSTNGSNDGTQAETQD